MKTRDLGGDEYILSFNAFSKDFYYSKASANFAVELLLRLYTGQLDFAIILYGSPGCGKTLLVTGFYFDYVYKYPGKKAVFLPTKTFVEEMVSAARANTIEAFEEKYGSIDLLILDDLDYLEGRPNTQRRIGEIIERIRETGGITILVSNNDADPIKDNLSNILNPHLMAESIPCDMHRHDRLR